MKSILFGLFCLLSLNSNGQEMIEINQVVAQLFVATDQKDWQAVEACFAEKVELDYSSMSGIPASSLTPNEITTAWKSILPGFKFTHHQVGNFIGELNEDSAHVFCYGTATHYLENEAGNVWTVVGSYDFDLIKQNNQWKVKAMTFNFKYQDGNVELPALAMEKVKNKKKVE